MCVESSFLFCVCVLPYHCLLCLCFFSFLLQSSIPCFVFLPLLPIAYHSFASIWLDICLNRRVNLIHMCVPLYLTSSVHKLIHILFGSFIRSLLSVHAICVHFSLCCLSVHTMSYHVMSLCFVSLHFI